MTPRVLIVEPDTDRLLALEQLFADIAVVKGCTDFATARGRLLHDHPDWLVTNVRRAALSTLTAARTAFSSRRHNRQVRSLNRRNGSLSRSCRI